MRKKRKKKKKGKIKNKNNRIKSRKKVGWSFEDSTCEPHGKDFLIIQLHF